MKRHLFRFFLLALVTGLFPAAAEQEVRVGTYDFRPLVYTRAETAQHGLFFGLLTEVARTEGWRLRQVPGTLDEGWTRLAAGEIDLLLAAPYSKERATHCLYSKESVFSTWAQVYVPRKQKLETLLDLAGKSIAVCQSTPYATELASLANGFSLVCRIVECKNDADVLHAVSRKWVDAGVVDRLYGLRYENLYDVTRTSVLFAPIDLRFATAKGCNAAKLSSIDFVLREMKAHSGSMYYTLVNRVLGQDVAMARAESTRGTLAWTGALGLAALLVILRLRREVKQTAGKLTEKEQHLHAEVLSRRRAESDVNECSRFLEGIFRTLRDGILVVDPTWQRILQGNPSASVLFGIHGDDELVRTTPASLFPSPEAFSAFVAQAVSDVARDGFVRMDFRLCRRNGQTFPAEMVVSPIADDKKRPVSFVVAIRDTTEQVATQAALQESDKRLRQAQKMEAIGTLAGGIAHDLNNILTPILCCTELLLANEPADSPRRDDLETIRSSGERARDLIRQVLLFSRPQEDNRQPLRVSSVVQEVRKFLRSALPATVEIRHSLLAKNDTILANPVQIHQVLLNLCTNAAHAMRENGGVLEISLRDFAGAPKGVAGMPILPDGRYLELAVRDTGHGIDHAVVERIFDPFFTTKKAGEGTGMGLALVHGIVRGCGGCVAVESTPGHGSTFRVFLPTAEPTREAAPAEMAPLVAGKERVLIVDDEVSLGQVLARSLERLGYQTVICQSATQATRVFGESPAGFDLVISDQTMPGMTGTELAAELRRMRPDVPIILCSGYNDGTLHDKARKAGIREFLHKPFSANELATVIQRLAIRPALLPS